MLTPYNFYKFIRFIRIYGIRRSLFKIFGRLRPNCNLEFFLIFPLFKKKGLSVGIVGAGHHAYSSIAYHLKLKTNSKISFVLDKNIDSARTLAVAFNALFFTDDGATISPSQDFPSVVYICSNHSTHFEYAKKFINLNADVFIEKPLVTNFSQLEELDQLVINSGIRVFAGYNRPFSKAIEYIRKRFVQDLPFSLSSVIFGHQIPSGHWYRDHSEGSRIISNLGHWIDLSIHFLFRKIVPIEFITIKLTRIDEDKFCDNIIISIVSDQNDLISIFFTTRSDPFEGVYESILFQQDEIIAKIDDFRSLQIWNYSLYKKFTFYPKDNGHANCVLQPIDKTYLREWIELKTSTYVMLTIEEMVKANIHEQNINFNEINTSIS